MVRSAHAALAQTLLLLAACSSSEQKDAPDSSAPPAPTCTAPDRVPTFADLQRGILPICLECHSVNVTGEARQGAPVGLNFDTYEQFANAAELAAYLVRYRIMPKPDGGAPTPTEEQRQELYDWAACGKPR